MAAPTPVDGNLSSGRENFVWLVGDKCLRLVAGVCVSLIVARHLGPGRFGLLAYATSLVSLLLPLAELGVDLVVRRRLILAPDDAGRLLALVWRARLVAGFLMVALLLCWLLLFSSHSAESPLILILAITLLYPAGMTADLWLQANLLARRATLASWIALALGAAVRLQLVWLGAPLTAFAWAAVGEGALNCLLIWVAARRAGLPARVPSTASPLLRELLIESWPMLLSGLTVTLYMRIDMVMLRHLAGENATGVYAAAVRLSELWYFVPGALAASLLPGLLRRQAENETAYRQALARYYDLSAMLAYTAAGATCLFAGPLVRLAYGAEFLEAIAVLRWHAWAVVFVFMGVARSQYLVNAGRTGFHLMSTLAGAVLNVLLNLWLIPTHGPLGAAWATLGAYGLAAWGASWLHPQIRANAVLQTRALLVPLLGWRYLFRR
jgi:PST family polysaccharide transporter